MRLTETSLKGAYLIELIQVEDDRGFFARAWCRREFSDLGLNPRLEQIDVSYNRQRGTLRGIHYQAPPFEEAKVVRCTSGALYDVIVDLRPASATFGKWASFELNASNRRGLYVPEGVAHGFLTLLDDTEVLYLMSEVHSPEHARGLRWDDPALGVVWPVQVTVISERDRTYPDWNPS